MSQPLPISEPIESRNVALHKRAVTVIVGVASDSTDIMGREDLKKKGTKFKFNFF